MDIARSETGLAGIKDVLRKWTSSEEDIPPLKRLERALVECRVFLRDLGKDMARQRRERETQLRKVLVDHLLKIPEADGAELVALQGLINDVARQLENLGEGPQDPGW